MKKILFLLLLIMVFTSCKKVKEVIVTESSALLPPTLAYFPMTIGSYWVYQNVKIDTLGNETITSSTDTVRITGDTIINSNTYIIMKGMVWINCSSSCENYYRDSSGYIVTPGGKTVFSQSNLGDTLWIESEPSYATYYYKMKTGDSTIIVPSGTYETIVAQKYVYFTNPSYPWGSPRIDQHYYADGIGKILERNFFESTPEYYEGRLIAYYIAP